MRLLATRAGNNQGLAEQIAGELMISGEPLLIDGFPIRFI